MQQILYWHAPVWQVVLVVAVLLIGMGWLIYGRFHRPPVVALPAQFASAQPLFFYTPEAGIVGLNAEAHKALQNGGDIKTAVILTDVMSEAMAEERIIHQEKLASLPTPLLIFPIFDQENAVCGALASAVTEIEPLLAESSDSHSQQSESETTNSSWQPISPRLQRHTTGARIRVLRQGEWVENELSYAEQQLLQQLVEHANEAVSADALFTAVWPDDPTNHGLQSVHRDRLRRLVYQLRRNIEPAPKNPTHLVTVHGVGYIFYTQSAS